MHNFVHNLILSVLGWTGRPLIRRHGAIFCLHSVSRAGTAPDEVGPMAITDAFLERMIVDLRRRKVALVSLDEALRRIKEGHTGQPFVALTFDDGYRDNHDVAYPVLLRHEVPFAIFLTTALIDRRMPMWWHVLEHVVANNDRVELDGMRLPAATPAEKKTTYQRIDQHIRQQSITAVDGIVDQLVTLNRSTLSREAAYDLCLDWDTVRHMADGGLATFGCHTVSHPMLIRLSADDIRTEVYGSRDRVTEEMGRLPAYFAYPFGQDNEVGREAPDIVREAGFTAAFTTERFVLRPNRPEHAFRIPRIMLDRRAQRESIVRAHLSGLPSALKNLRRPQTPFPAT